MIAGRSGGMTDAVQDAVTGLLVNPLDTEEVAAAIIKLLREPGVARVLGNNGRKWVQSEMNWTRAADEFQQAMGQFFPGPSLRRQRGGLATYVRNRRNLERRPA